MCEIEIKIAYIKKHVYQERKETTYEKVGEKNIHQHIKKIITMYVNNGHKTQGTRRR